MKEQGTLENESHTALPKT